MAGPARVGDADAKEVLDIVVSKHAGAQAITI